MANLKPQKILKIKELVKKGLTERAVAKKLGCSRATVWYWKKKKFKQK